MKNRLSHFLIASFLVFPILSCNNKQANEELGDKKNKVEAKSSAFFTINFAKIIKHKREVSLSETAEDVEFVQFENFNESLLGNVFDTQLTPEFIFVMHSGSRLLARFNRNGKSIRHIGIEGRGPKEYGLIRIFSLDDNQIKNHYRINQSISDFLDIRIHRATA